MCGCGIEAEHQKAIATYHKQWAEFEEKMTTACRVSKGLIIE